MKKSKVEQFTDSLKSDNGNWLNAARERKANRAWLRKSQEIALRILSVLREKGMQQKKLASMLGVSPQQVSKIVKGKENLTLETISKIEMALGAELINIAEKKSQVSYQPVSVSPTGKL
ncbi:helix-turn-helix protein [Cyclonatronum proteinivorum]|uniref:Helix-turn-helix protein n=1 Tax=Cyclonatronum proteinivorum TaxID=1457365 RepID=A0A345UPZ8_9BACT|nr:helix-turn-helix transcriptional regulator [Cyclonatronum proteinivorum]AXJ02550.1 helix-turn-helix protein [Cyclonatronum proteinivorum]